MIWQLVRDSGIGFNPFTERSHAHRSMDRLFGDTLGYPAFFPSVNVWSGENEAVVTAEIPGVDPKNLALTVTGDVLTIEGERKTDSIGEDDTLHRCERSGGKFSKTVRLPYEIENDAVKAKVANGILRITLARKESSKPRKIEVQTE